MRCILRNLTRIFARNTCSRACVRLTSRLRWVQGSLLIVLFTCSIAFTSCECRYPCGDKLSPRLFSTSRHYDSRIIVRVPSMAERNLEPVQQADWELIEPEEELATIETGTIDFSVNSPQSGLFVGEGNVGTVDQEIAEIDAGEQAATQDGKSNEPTLKTNAEAAAKHKPENIAHAPA
ncbi:hypothetical protein N7508_010574 [Penicillium antarcticum]|uniref:uncharacterized protein n=1 Tax=Penicillium antarcticum TaxID=416450 RepID=UPI0023A22B3A|nr:uncharacterized protein N7508_010574 [Penicillium antarcticum]KAJ5295753.1 hypothetical protein N7508_010574 [Penicillium antarcticum]